ncbi:MAG: glycosyltransferase family 9 protein [candidate division KSB1 bacterium]|nr:glycosyltransferase family 9 protein [candidate division KSB1 bacterium]
MRVLLVRTDRMGDVILSTPVATLLKEAHPDWQVDMLVSAWLAPLVRIHRDVDAVLTCQPERQRVRDLAHELRLRKYDAAVLLHPKPALAFALWLARIPLRIGTRYRAYSFLLNRRVAVHRKHSPLHELELNVLTAAPLGLAPIAHVNPLFRFSVPEEAEAAVSAKLEAAGAEPNARPIVVHPGSGGSARDWPIDRFAELLRDLAELSLGSVVVTGSSTERTLVDTLVALSQTPLVRLDGQLSVVELAALLRRARLVVANSTGPLHLAVAMGTPVVGLYCPVGPCHPRRWGPYGRPNAVVMPEVPECSRCRKSCPYYDCMASIPAGRVLEKIREVLDDATNVWQTADPKPTSVRMTPQPEEKS